MKDWTEKPLKCVYAPKYLCPCESYTCPYNIYSRAEVVWA